MDAIINPAPGLNAGCNPALSITFFKNNKNPTGVKRDTDWQSICNWLKECATVVVSDRDSLCLIKLAVFQNNYRNDQNLQWVYGIEGDYDAGMLPVMQAVEILGFTGIESFVYTTTRHTDERPRFRILCPLSKPIGAQDRSKYVANLNGVLSGVLASESFSLSQSFYVGSVAGNQLMQCYHVAGWPIDLMPDLPSIGGEKAEISQRVNSGRLAPNYNIALEALMSRHPADGERDWWLKFSGAFFTATRGLTSDEQRLNDWQAWNLPYGEKNDAVKNLATWRDFERNGTSGDFLTLADMSDNANAKGWAYFGEMKIQSNKVRGFQFTRWDQLETTKQQWIIEGIIPEGLCQLFGASGSGKSFVAISMGMSIAAGIPWFGHNTRAGDVIYICGEGKAGIKKRLKAWEARYGQNISPIPFYVSSERVNFPDPASIAQVKRAIETLNIKPGFIIIDTFSRNFVGNENDTQDMAGFIRAIDDLKDHYGASVAIIHHTGHGDKERGRGSSVAKGAMDAEFLIEKSGEQITFQCRKMKDSQEPVDKKFELANTIQLVNGFPESEAVLVSAGFPALHERTVKTISLLQSQKDELSKDDLFDLLVKKGILNGKPDTQQRYFRGILADFQNNNLDPQWVRSL